MAEKDSAEFSELVRKYRGLVIDNYKCRQGEEESEEDFLKQLGDEFQHGSRMQKNAMLYAVNENFSIKAEDPRLGKVLAEAKLFLLGFFIKMLIE